MKPLLAAAKMLFLLGWRMMVSGSILAVLGATAYSQAVGVYLAFAIDRLADYGSSIATWKPSGGASYADL
ncbi:Uncharacterised protein [Escherichia coli]|nr:Uncharacterised protein [Escherichia coli]